MEWKQPHMGNIRPMYQPPQFNVHPHPQSRPHPRPPLSIPPKAPLWTTHEDPNGRKYYYNVLTKQSSWEKPDELKTPLERALAKCQWKEYTTNGKKYYYNEETKVSSWEMPQEYKDLILKNDKRPQLQPQTQIKPQPQPQLQSQLQPQPQIQSQPKPQPLPIQVIPKADSIPKSNVETIKPPTSSEPIISSTISEVSKVIPANAIKSDPNSTIRGKSVIIDFKSKEEAEEAFKNLLKESGVKSSWTWKETVCATASNPLYYCLKTAEERKSTFLKYIDQCKREEREEERAKIQKEKDQFRLMLEKKTDITSTTRYRKYKETIKDEPEFLAINDERECEIMFDEYVNELRRKEKDKIRMERKENMEKFRQLLKKLPISYNTLWKDAQVIFKSSDEYQSDKQMQSMDSLDIFSVYEEHIKQLELKYMEMKDHARMIKRREERKNRDAFKECLKELRASHVINVRSKWKEIFPYIQNDKRYLNMLGQEGSTPLELFWDNIQELEEDSYQEKKSILELIKAYDIKVTPDLNFPVFLSKLPIDRIKGIEESIIHLVYDDCIYKAKIKIKEEKRKEEKRLKKKMEIFKYTLKKANPPITVTSTWEEIKPRFENKSEFQALQEENRIEVFEKYIKRLKEKEAQLSEEEGTIDEDRERSRKRKKHEHDKDHDKKRRHHHYHHSDYEDDKKLYKKKPDERVEEPEDGELC